MKITENNFIPQLKLRNEKALEYVIDEYGNLIASIVKKHLFYLRDYHEECMDDVLLAVWFHIDGFDECKGSFSNWIAGVSKYKSLNYLRKYLKEQKNINIDDVEIVEEDKELRSVIEKELSEEMEIMLTCFNNKDRELFIELFVHDKNVDEVSRKSGIKKEVIYNRVSRGKNKIRDHFKILKGEGKYYGK